MSTTSSPGCFSLALEVGPGKSALGKRLTCQLDSFQKLNEIVKRHFFFKFVLLNVRSLAAFSVIKKVICYIFQMFIFCLILSFDVILLFY